MCEETTSCGRWVGMRREPSLTFQGALEILGHGEHPWLKKLDNALGGAILGAGVAVAVAAVGPPVLAPATMFAAVWGWTEQKGLAISLLGQAVARVSKRIAGTKGYERRQLIAAAHTAIVVAAFFEALKEEIGTQAFDKLEISELEKQWLVSQRSRSDLESIYDLLYVAEVPAPSAALGFEENVGRIRSWNHQFAEILSSFLSGLSSAEQLRFSWPHVIGRATERYRTHFLSLAHTVPDFMIWASLNEHAATRTAIAEVHADVAKAGAAAADIQDAAAALQVVVTELRGDFRAALETGRRALSRTEALLALDAPAGDVFLDLREALRRANRGVLSERIIAADPKSYGPHITFPVVSDIYIDPRYRVATARFGRPTDDNWWARETVRDDFDLMLAGYVTSPDAARLPLLLLGHPGAGKSLLTKVLAARLPASAYTVVRVPLRRVGANAPLIDQVQGALDLATNRRVEWWRLTEQSADTIRVVLLDGLDELLQASQHDRSGYLQEVMEFQRRENDQHHPVVVIVTSRTVVADRVDIPDGTVIVKLDPFDEDDIAAWISQWNQANSAAIADGNLRALTMASAQSQPDLAQQPLLLLLLALYAANLDVPALDEGISTAVLYGRLLEQFAHREAARTPSSETRAGDLEERVQDHLDRLVIAALAMFNRGRQDIAEEELGSDLAAIDERLMARSRPAEAGQRIIGEFFFVHAPEAQMVTGTSPSDTSDTRPSPPRQPPRRAYEFLHATFGEYLVARRLMDELIEATVKTFASRRPSEPDDDLLWALLCHQPLAARRSAIDFMREISDTLTGETRGRLLNILELLLGQYRNRHDSNRYAAYRPTPPDLVRQMACYSANVVVLRVALEPGSDGVTLPRLIGTRDVLDQWRSTVQLWKAGLDASGLQAMLATIELSEDPVSISLTQPLTEATGEPIASDILLSRLINDRQMEYRLRLGYSIADGHHYYDGRDWAAMMTSCLIPAIAGSRNSFTIFEPPPNTPEQDIRDIARLIFRYLRTPTKRMTELDFELVRLIFSMPQCFDMDGLALAIAVEANPDLPGVLPQLENRDVYGSYARLASILQLRQEIEVPRLPKLAIAAIQRILDDQRRMP